MWPIESALSLHHEYETKYLMIQKGCRHMSVSISQYDQGTANLQHVNLGCLHFPSSK